MKRPEPPKPGDYLTPYRDAVSRHGAGFKSLLWASRLTQRARFDAIAQAVRLRDRVVLDAGCGRGDLWTYLCQQHAAPARYIGMEAVAELADAARQQTRQTILHADFLQSPARMLVGADVIVFCGSLNTIDDPTLWVVLEAALTAAPAVVFNFLCSDLLAGRCYLYWRDRGHMEEWCRTMADRVQVLDDYMDGDCTIAMRRRP